MPRVRITKTSAAVLEWTGRQTRYFDTKLSGFGVQVNERSRTYICQCKINGKSIVTTLGRVDVVKYDHALERARAIMEDAAKGISPKDRKREREEIAKAAEKIKIQDASRDFTVSEAFQEYLTTHKSLRPRSVRIYTDDLKNHLGDWLNLPLRSITKKMILAKHAEIGAKFPAQANKVMRVLRAIYNMAMVVHDSVILSNPVAVLSVSKAWYPRVVRSNYIRGKDLPAWFDQVDRLFEPNARVALQLLLFTGARKEEVFALKWEDVDLENGTVLLNVKGGKTLQVPLCRHVIGLLEEHKQYFYRSGGHVFPSPSESGHITDMRYSINGMVRRGAPEFTPHDLRRSFMSYCESLRIPVFTIKRLTGHALPSDVTQGYIQFDMETLRRAVETVAAYILRHAGRLPSKVVDLDERRVKEG